MSQAIFKNVTGEPQKERWRSEKQIKIMAITGSIYKVRFTEPPLKDDDRTEFFYSSLSAIFEDFTPEQVGCGVRRLWNLQIAQGKPYVGRLCQITREPLNSAAQMRGSKSRSESK
mgnify:CR=1 FL=1